MKPFGVLVMLTLAGGVVQPLVAAAQTVPEGCACFSLPVKSAGVPDNPGLPGTPASPGENGPGSGNPDLTSGDRNRWIYLGATGLAVLAGLPVGGATVGGLPFAQGAPGGPAPMLADANAAGADVPTVVSPGEIAPPLAAEPGSAGGNPSRPAGALTTPTGPAGPAFGIVPPKTATHLPLVGAFGVLLIGLGALLARQGARSRRRRRRFIPI